MLEVAIYCRPKSTKGLLNAVFGGHGARDLPNYARLTLIIMTRYQ